MVDRFEAFTHMISEVSQYWNKIATLEMKKYGLKGLYALYLVTLSRHSDGITAAELSEISNKDKAEISRAVSVLEKNNLVKRCNISNNSYRARILLTEEGDRVANYLCGRVKIIVEAASDGVTDEEREIFYKALGIISENLKNISRDGEIE